MYLVRQINVYNNNIVNNADPVNNQDVSTKNYVDNSLTYNLNNNSTTTSTKLNLNAPELTSLQVYKTPSTNYDVVNKLYLTNYKMLK